jgi:hypothetical protein
VTKTLPCLILALTLAACGGGNAPANNAPAHEHPSGHVAGQFDLGDGWFMQASHDGSIEAGTEVLFEIVMKKDGEPAPDAVVRIHVADKDGKELTDKAQAKWDADKKLYTCRLKLPPAVPADASMTFEADVNGKSFKRSVAITGHQHD